MSCYTYKQYDTKQGSLDPSIDCTYVLVMENSPRMEQIYEQLIQAGLTSTIIFQVNKGFKNCKKEGLRAPKPNYDLEHANKAAFRHALERGYKRVLVVEDDCEFDDRVRDPEVIDDINTFLIQKDPCIYNMGPVITFCSPIGILMRKKHRLMLHMTHTHAIIYNEECMKKLIHRNFWAGHADMELNRHLSKYTYHKPLAYQKIDLNTENMKDGWGPGWQKFADWTLVKPTGIDKKVQPGYDRIRMMCDFIILVLVLFILIKVFGRFINKRT